MIRVAAIFVLAGLLTGAAVPAEPVATPQPQASKKKGPDLTSEPDLTAVLAAGGAAAESAAAPGISYRVIELPPFGLKIHAWTFDQSRFQARVVEQKAPKGSPVADVIGTSVFAINGGFFERNKEDHVLSPSGLLIARGKEIAAENDRAGSGIVYVGADGGLAIGYRKRLTDHAGMREAIQVGPILVDPGGKVGVVNKQHDRDKRSAICLRPGTFTAVVVEGGLSLFQFASLLAAPTTTGGFGCESAINLDGGPSSQAVFRGGGRRIEVGGWPVENALVVSTNPG
jgi:uncharacterized protein YigE (DUF2233 family)